MSAAIVARETWRREFTAAGDFKAMHEAEAHAAIRSEAADTQLTEGSAVA